MRAIGTAKGAIEARDTAAAVVAAEEVGVVVDTAFDSATEAHRVGPGLLQAHRRPAQLHPCETGAQVA